MAWSEEEKFIVIAILLIVLALAVYIELKVFRGKAKEARKAAQRKDEAFNAVLTTRAVLNAMKRQGRDTSQVQSMLAGAKKALGRGEYSKCMDLCESAREELIHSKAVEQPRAPEKEPIDEFVDKLFSDSTPTPPREDYKGTALPLDKEPNYLQARFEIGAARAELQKFADSGHDTTSAYRVLAEAEAASESRNYAKALSLALRARKEIGGDALKETIPLRKAETAPTPPAPAAAALQAEQAETAVPPVRGRTCDVCGEPIEEDDTFCGRCGARVPRERLCPQCGVKARPADVFCRKCGTKLS